MHGLGNDFVVVDLRDADDALRAAALDPARVRALSDRHTGIGFDQWLTIHAATGPADADYRILNADGTEVGQCGNGARCIAAWLADRGGVGDRRAIRLGSAGGEVTAHVDDDGSVTTTLPTPRFEPRDIPLSVRNAAARYPLAFDGATLEFAALSVGNPHCVIFVDDVDATPLARIADAVDASGLFPKGVNVGVAEVCGAQALKLRVRERGVGETRACGTGAAAAAVAGIRDAHVTGPVSVRLPGGTLVVDWRPPDGGVRITGPATTAFEGFVTL